MIQEQTDASNPVRWPSVTRLEVALLILVMALAAYLRLWELTTLPPGLHGDEAITGLEGQRILQEGWIGPYSLPALGQPAGPLYLTAVSVALFTNTVLAVRLVPTILSILTVLALYVVTRRSAGPRPAILAAAMLAVMGWHVHFAHIGYPLSAWPLTAVLAVGMLDEAHRRRTWPWWFAAGAAAGLGVHAYHSHLIFLVPLGLVALGVIIARGGSVPRRLGMATAFAVGWLLIASPMIHFAADPNNDYFAHARGVSVFERDEWTALNGRGAQAAYLGDRYRDFWKLVCCEPTPDYVDASGQSPLVPRGMLVLAALGAILTAVQRRWMLLSLSLLTLAIMPISSIVTIQGMSRRTFVIVPFLALLAGLGIGESYGIARRFGRSAALITLVTLAVFGGMVAGRGIAETQRNLGTDLTRWVFADDLYQASLYLRDLPDEHYILFYSNRWSLNYETRQFVAPDVVGEDRSAEFGDGIFEVDPELSPVVFVLLGSYLEAAPDLLERFPDAAAHFGGGPQRIMFIAIIIPAQSGGVNMNEEVRIGTTAILRSSRAPDDPHSFGTGSQQR